MPMFVSRYNKLTSIKVLSNKTIIVCHVCDILKADVNNNISYYNEINWAYSVKCLLDSLGLSEGYLTTHSTHFIYFYMASDIW